MENKFFFFFFYVSTKPRLQSHRPPHHDCTRVAVRQAATAVASPAASRLHTRRCPPSRNCSHIVLVAATKVLCCIQCCLVITSGVARKFFWGEGEQIQRVFPSPSLPSTFSFLPFTSLSLPSLPLPFSLLSPSPPLSLPSLALEVGPLKYR